MQNLVLILCHHDDASAQAVIDQIRHRGQSVLSLDTASFPGQLTLDARIGGQARWEGTIAYEGTKYDLASIKSVYVRRPNHYQVRDDLPEPIQAFLENEAHRGFGGVLRSLDCLWVNAFEAQRAAGFKPLQLKMAQEVGLSTPPTIITNDPDAVRVFWDRECQGKMIYKTLHGGAFFGGGRDYHLIYTSRVFHEHLEQLPRVRQTAHLFQPCIEKAFEVRATVIGQQVLSVAIFSPQSSDTIVDWRAHYQDLQYRVYELPEPVKQCCIQVVARLGLVFGALDLIVTPEGDHIFLECNGGGQWQWLEYETNLPFSATIAEVLMAGKGEDP